VCAHCGGFGLAAVLVVLAARSLAYALAPRPTTIANRLEWVAGGPRLVAVTLAALSLGLIVSSVVVWMASFAVAEWRYQEPTAVTSSPRIALAPLALRALLMWLVSSLGFALFESYVHWRAGLGWHGLTCLLGPYHRNAIPILAALSLLAAALISVIRHLVAWMRRSVAALARVRRRVSGDLALVLFPLEAPARLCRPALRSLGPRGPPLAISTRIRACC
jgi:hypothetical protein